MNRPVVVITGASSGIGKALAYEFASKGYNLSISSRTIDLLIQIESDIQNKYKVDVIAIQTDVTSKDSCKELIDQTITKFGRIDVLINNAGISMRATLLDVDLNVFESVMDVNFRGTVYCTKFALPHIIASKGSIVGISSIAGYRGLPERTGYSSSKFAMQGFLESLRTELLPTGVHVLIACPGFTKSNIRMAALTADGSTQNESPRDEEKMMSAETVAKHIFNAVIKRKRTLILTTVGKLTVFLNKFFGKWMDQKVYNNFKKEPR